MNICLEPFETIKLEDEIMQKDATNLENIDMSNGEFEGQNYQHHNFLDADFSASTFAKCDFTSADLTGVDMTNTDFTECAFSGAQISDCDRIDGTNFFACDLRDTDFSGSVLRHVAFNACNADNANFEDAEVIECSIQLDEGMMFSKSNKDMIYYQIATALIPAMKHSNIECGYIAKLIESNAVRQILESLAEEELFDKQIGDFIKQYYRERFETLL